MDSFSSPGTMSCFVFKYFYFERERERERERVHKTGEGQRGRERISSKFHTLCKCGAQHGARYHNHEIVTWAKIKSQMLNQLSHHGATRMSVFKWKEGIYLRAKKIKFHINYANNLFSLIIAWAFKYFCL